MWLAEAQQTTYRAGMPMNAIHRRLCRSDYWTNLVHSQLLPWALRGVPLDGEVLEIGPGYGVTTRWLAQRTERLTAIEVDPALAAALRAEFAGRVEVRHGDGAALPFAAGSFPAVAAIWISTDVDDFGAVLGEAARVLQPGGVFVFYGAHPCFNGPHTQLLDDGGVIAHPAYRAAGWHRRSPWWNEGRVRARVGMRHHPLGELLTAFITAGLRIERVAEPGDRPVPNALAIVARKQDQ